MKDRMNNYIKKRWIIRNLLNRGIGYIRTGKYTRALASFKKIYRQAILYGKGKIASVMMHFICYCYSCNTNPDGLIDFCDSERVNHFDLLEVGMFAFYYSIACLSKEQYQKAADIAEIGIRFELRKGDLKIVHPAFYYEIAFKAYSALGF